MDTRTVTNLDFIVGTTDAEKQRAIDLLNSFNRATEADGRSGSGDVLQETASRVLGGRGPILLANAISVGLRTRGVFDFTGQQISSARDLAAIAQRKFRTRIR